MHAKAIELLVTAIAGAIIGMVGFAGLWYRNQQKERPHETSESSGELNMFNLYKVVADFEFDFAFNRRTQAVD